MARLGEHLLATDVAGDLTVLDRMVAYAINERMARRLGYVQEEVRVFREALLAATGKNRIAFTVEQRQRLAIKGRLLTPDERRGCCQLVRPATILKRFRELAAKRYDGSIARGPGRPRKPYELRELVLRLANENIGWGYTKIRDALRGMKIEIDRTTVATILAEAGLSLHRNARESGPGSSFSGVIGRRCTHAISSASRPWAPSARSASWSSSSSN